MRPTTASTSMWPAGRITSVSPATRTIFYRHDPVTAGWPIDRENRRDPLIPDRPTSSGRRDDERGDPPAYHHYDSQKTTGTGRHRPRVLSSITHAEKCHYTWISEGGHKARSSPCSILSHDVVMDHHGMGYYRCRGEKVQNRWVWREVDRTGSDGLMSPLSRKTGSDPTPVRWLTATADHDIQNDTELRIQTVRFISRALRHHQKKLVQSGERYNIDEKNAR